MKPRRPRRAFVDLRPADIAPGAPVDPGLFLGRLDPETLREALARAGLLGVLAARGYANVDIRTRLESGEHRLQILPTRGRVRLVDLRLEEAAILADAPEMRARGLGVLSILSVHWLALQDPKRRFTAERPRLPGQRYPGLGLGKRMYEELMGWARAWGKDALLNVPAYFHNAVFYSSIFRFFSPARQGRFEALRRDLASLPVARASWAVERGQVREEPGGRALRWEPGEMVAPLTEGLRSNLESREHRAAADAAAGQVRFRVD